MPTEKWFVIAFEEWACRRAYNIIVKTDRPCHQWMRWTINLPRRHPRHRVFRGLDVMGDVYYCFTSYHDVEQDEPGDTYTHTFTISPWAVDEVRFFYFWGEVAAQPSPSTSPMFGRQIHFTSYYYLGQVTNPNDEMYIAAGGAWSCPSNCPLQIVVGRWQTEAQIQGGVFIIRAVALPRCAYITSAFLRFYALTNDSLAPVNSQVSFENVLHPASWYNTSTPDFFARWNTRAGVVNWDNIETWVAGFPYDSPDISPTIQAAVSRTGWNAGFNLCLFWDDRLQRTPWRARRNRQSQSYTWAPSNAPQLFVNYEHWQVRSVPVF